MTSFYNWIRTTFETNQGNLAPVVDRFRTAMRASKTEEELRQQLMSEPAFQALMSRFMDEKIKSNAKHLLFDTRGHQSQLDGRNLSHIQAAQAINGAFQFDAIEAHLALSMAYLLRDIAFGKHTLFGLKIKKYSFSMPDLTCDHCGTHLELIADIRDRRIAPPRYREPCQDAPDCLSKAS